MKSILLSAFLSAAILSGSAAEINLRDRVILPDNPISSNSSFKEKYEGEKISVSREKLMDKNFFQSPGIKPLSNDGLVTNPQGNKVRYAMAANIFLSNMGYVHIGGFGADFITSEDGNEIYSKAFTLNFFQQGYTEGNVDGEDIIINSGQYVYNTFNDEKAYMYAAYLEEGESWPEFVDTFILTKDDQGCYVSPDGYYLMVMTQEEAEGGINEYTDIICYGTNYVFTPLPENLEETSLPSDAELFDCQLAANSLVYEGASIIMDITVGVKGDKVYIGGLSDYLPDAYLVGTITSDNSVTFNSHQYIGYYDEGDYPYIYEFAMVNPIYFYDYSLYYNEVNSVTMTFNEEKTTLTIEEDAGVFVCAYGDLNSWEEVYWNMMIGDLNQPLTPTPPIDLSVYNSYVGPYIFFQWDNISVEGIPMVGSQLWCEVIINGEPYTFLPEYYPGLKEATTRVYYNTLNVEGLYVGDYSTIYLYEFLDNIGAIKSLGVKIGFESGDETRYTDLIYADGFEPSEDKAFVPSQPSHVSFYRTYVNTIRFDFDDTDIEGNIIPGRLLAIEILVDGEPLVFKDSDYYFGDGNGPDVTMIGLANNAINYSAMTVSHYENYYIISLWGHDELWDFSTLAIRPVCTGADTITYGESCEINLERAATPANPWDLVYNDDYGQLTFGALPIDTFGEGLAPWNYGYEVYVNDELYTFKADLYDLEKDITVIPYEGFEYNYNFYISTQYIYDETTWATIGENVVMEVSMGLEDLDIQKIGVRAVYTDGNGVTTYSDIVNNDGTTGISKIEKDSDEVRWFNLQGVEIDRPEASGIYLRTQGNKTSKIFIK